MKYLIVNELLDPPKERVSSRIVIDYGSSEKEFILYFKHSDNPTNGKNIIDGWGSYAFISNELLDDTKKGARILGRNVSIPKSLPFNKVAGRLKNSKDGKYQGHGVFIDEQLDFLFDNNIFKGRWRLMVDKKASKRNPRVWLIKVI